MLFGAGAAISQIAGPVEAQQSARAVAGAVRIGSNECWTGPFAEGVAGGRGARRGGATATSPTFDHAKLFAAVAEVEGISPDCVLAWPGSSDPLSRSVVTFCSPDRPLVTANPDLRAELGHRRPGWG